MKIAFDGILKRIGSVPAETGHVFGKQELLGNILRELFICIEKECGIATHVFLNPKDYLNLRMWDRDVIELEMEAWKLCAGIMGKMWDAEIIISQEIPFGEVVVGAFKEFTGQDDIIVRWKLEYKERTKSTGKAYAIQVGDQPPELPDGQQWRVLKIGMAICEKPTVNNTISSEAVACKLPSFFIVGTDWNEIRQEMIDKLDAMIEALKPMEGSLVC